jgi:MOSC domain-containing protein YiiM
MAQPKPMDEKYVGFMARVVEGGKVQVGDAVKVLEQV